MLQGFREADSSSWGGSIVYSEQDSMYHMYPSRMAGHCGLNAWFANSAIVHAVSDTPLGPYAYSSTVIQPFAHEGPPLLHLGVCLSIAPPPLHLALVTMGCRRT